LQSNVKAINTNPGVSDDSCLCVPFKLNQVRLEFPITVLPLTVPLTRATYGKHSCSSSNIKYVLQSEEKHFILDRTVVTRH
jgi:hypothetical protein